MCTIFISETLNSSSSISLYDQEIKIITKNDNTKIHIIPNKNILSIFIKKRSDWIFFSIFEWMFIFLIEKIRVELMFLGQRVYDMIWTVEYPNDIVPFDVSTIKMCFVDELLLFWNTVVLHIFVKDENGERYVRPKKVHIYIVIHKY
jgi:hypothetical protein